ncbi:MAG: metallophosphoesterase [Bacillota bacterium]|nr:metallophosphoesterase [Bacillota bacterium]
MKKSLIAKALTCILALTCIMATSTFAATTVNKPSPKPLWNAGATRNKIVCISDLHLGVNDKSSQDTVNRPNLIDFINRVGQTKDIRELVIAGDFLDEWVLPLNSPVSTDSQQYLKQCITNNQSVINALKGLSNTGVKLVYVLGNHDMNLVADTLKQAMPNITFVGANGVGDYITGDRKEIAIEHGHRYDVLCAPDTVDNKDLSSSSILPPGYFYGRLVTSWIMQGMPTINKMIPELTDVPSTTNIDQYGAYIYGAFLNNISNMFTNIERFDDKVYNLKNYGFNTKFSEADILPVMQADGTISAPTLFKNYQRSWEQIQTNNGVRVHTSFIQAASVQFNGNTSFTQYYPTQESIQYNGQGIDTVVFGHTHVPLVEKFKNGISVLNDGSWVDTRTGNTNLTRTFAVVTTGKTDSYALYQYNGSTLTDITKQATMAAAN